MKVCPKCDNLFQEQTMACSRCQVHLIEISLPEAIKRSNVRSFQKAIIGGDTKELSDEHIQYHIRSFLGNRTLFLDFDIQKNRIKHGRKLKRFLIAPFNMTCVFNIPWLLFNIMSSNLFHLTHLGYCSRCNCKHIPGRHSQDQCDYNIEYFNILEDILNGQIVQRRSFYQTYALEQAYKKKPSAYTDLFCRKVRWEAFWDIVSITLSVLLWVFIVVFVAYPMAMMLTQKLMYIDSYEFGLPVTGG